MGKETTEKIYPKRNDIGGTQNKERVLMGGFNGGEMENRECSSCLVFPGEIKYSLLKPLQCESNGVFLDEKKSSDFVRTSFNGWVY